MNKEKIKSFLGNKYVEPIKKLLVQGTSPSALSIGISGALVIGTFPVIGSTTILCSLFALALRLNIPLVQFINYSVFPLQLMLLIPFMKLGEKIFGLEKLNYNLTEIMRLINNSPLDAITLLWNVTLQAIGAWFIIAPVAALFIHLLLHRTIKKIRYNYLKTQLMDAE